MQTMLDTIDTMLIPRFTNATVRDTKIPAPSPGMICYLLDVRHYTIYREGAWKKITIPIIRKTTAPVTWVNDTTKDVVAELTMPVVSGKKYRLDGVLFLNTPSVDYVDAQLQFDHPGGMFNMHLKFLKIDETQKADIHIRRQSLAAATSQPVGVVDNGTGTGSPVFMDGIYSCTADGNLTISMAQNTLSAVALELMTGSYLIAKEF